MSARALPGFTPGVEGVAARWIVAAAWLILFAVVGVPAMTLPTLFAGIVHETHWSRGDVALGTSLRFATGAIAAFLVGPLIEIAGLRRVVMALAALGGVALILFLGVHNIAVFYLSSMLIGCSQLGTAPAIKIWLSQTFNKSLGLSIGIAMTALSAAGMLLPVLITHLNGVWGWRLTGAVMSLPIWLLALPLFAVVSRGTKLHARGPGIGPDGVELPATLGAPSIGYGGLVASPAFWIIAASNFLIGMVDHGMIEHLVIYIDKDVGQGAQAAALAFSLMMVASTVGKFFYGWWFDRQSYIAVSICWFIAAVGCVLAVYIHSWPTLAPFIIVYGPCQAGMLLNIAILCKNCFNTRDLAKSIGLASGVYFVGGAVGPGFAGYMFDATGSYHAAFLTLGAAAVLAGLIVLLLRPAVVRRSALVAAALEA